MQGCIFCSIVEGTSPSHTVWEDEHTQAFLDIAPFATGHTLVVPKIHTEDLWSVDEETATRLMRSTHRVADLLRRTLEPEGMNLIQSTGAVAFQTVFHLHIHVIPRWPHDTMVAPPWPKSPASPDALTALATRIRGG